MWLRCTSYWRGGEVAKPDAPKEMAPEVDLTEVPEVEGNGTADRLFHGLVAGDNGETTVAAAEIGKSNMDKDAPARRVPRPSANSTDNFLI